MFLSLTIRVICNAIKFARNIKYVTKVSFLLFQQSEYVLKVVVLYLQREFLIKMK